MRKSVSFLCALACAAAWGQSEAVIEIDAAKVQHSIPRTVYGTFLQPIGQGTKTDQGTKANQRTETDQETEEVIPEDSRRGD